MKNYSSYFEWIDELNDKEEHNIQIISMGRNGWNVGIDEWTYNDNTLYRTLQKAYYAEHGVFIEERKEV